ncbi:TPA: hypothetical protein QFP50_000318 [Enterococcus faecium]|nr:hypothetical protein [Enterococcus faecium]
MSEDVSHYDIYKNYSILYKENGSKEKFFEGKQDDETAKIYQCIYNKLDEGYLDELYNSIGPDDLNNNISDQDIELIQSVVSSISSEKGRALSGLFLLQLVVKSIAPNQSIRLHKGSKRNGSFSWTKGISMRTLDSKFITPFLRKNQLLSINKDGLFMTRSFAENYPYSEFYKAEIRGNKMDWLMLVERVENQLIDAKTALIYLISALKNRSDTFIRLADETVEFAKTFSKSHKGSEIYDLIVSFFNNTTYSARAFEISMHSFMQAMESNGFLEGGLVPLSQMRSANKKHGNIGDIEVKYGEFIIESWDAKYGKPYLREELEELFEKLRFHPNVKIAGFVCDSKVDLREDIVKRMIEISDDTGVNIFIIDFKEWVFRNLEPFNLELQEKIYADWLIALAETLAQKRRDIAPIDEPSDEWLNDLKTSFILE